MKRSEWQHHYVVASGLVCQKWQIVSGATDQPCKVVNSVAEVVLINTSPNWLELHNLLVIKQRETRLAGRMLVCCFLGNRQLGYTGCCMLGDLLCMRQVMLAGSQHLVWYLYHDMIPKCLWVPYHVTSSFRLPRGHNEPCNPSKFHVQPHTIIITT